MSIGETNQTPYGGDDLIKQWDEYVKRTGWVMGDVEHMAQQMRDRIEQLERENARLDAGWSDANFRALDAGLKLAKAVDALDDTSNAIMEHTNDVEWIRWAEDTTADIRKVLAELEGKEVA